VIGGNWKEGFFCSDFSGMSCAISVDWAVFGTNLGSGPNSIFLVRLRLYKYHEMKPRRRTTAQIRRMITGRKEVFVL